MEAELQSQQDLRQLTKLNLSINQIKVIKDKYLKNSPTVEHWLRTVCHNIALGDVLHSNEVNEDEIFEGVNYKKIQYESMGKIANMLLVHHSLTNQDIIGDNFKKFIQNLEM